MAHHIIHGLSVHCHNQHGKQRAQPDHAHNHHAYIRHAILMPAQQHHPNSHAVHHAQ